MAEVTYVGDVTFWDISVYWSHCSSHIEWWYNKNAIFLEGKNVNSFTEFACLERLTFYNFVSVTKGRLTIRFFHAKRLLDALKNQEKLDALKNQ